MSARTRRSSSPPSRCHGGTCVNTLRTTPRAMYAVQLASACFIPRWRTVAEAGVGIGSAMRWIYDQYPARHRAACPIRSGHMVCPRERRCRGQTLDLQVGEVVRVKPYKDILKTSIPNIAIAVSISTPRWCRSPSGNTRSSAGKSRSSMKAPARWSTSRPTPSSSKMPSAKSRYAICRRFCPRAIYPYWREIWLERVPQDQVKTTCEHG